MINNNNIIIVIIFIFIIIWLYNKYLINKSLQNIQYKNDIIKIKIFDDYKYINLKKNNFHVITTITDINENYIKLVKSAKQHNIDVLPLISYKPIGHGKGFIMKFLLTYEYIKYLPDDHIVMFVDGYDVLVINNQENIINKYYDLTKGKKALFSSEKSCWPNSSFKSLYPETSSIYKYLNSGTYISTVKILKKLYIILMKKIYRFHYLFDFRVDDQECFTEIFLFENQDLIMLDYYADIFNCLYDSIDDIEFKDNKIYNKTTKTYPMVLHGNNDSVKHFLLNDIYNYVCN